MIPFQLTRSTLTCLSFQRRHAGVTSKRGHWWRTHIYPSVLLDDIDSLIIRLRGESIWGKNTQIGRQIFPQALLAPAYTLNNETGRLVIDCELCRIWIKRRINCTVSLSASPVLPSFPPFVLRLMERMGVTQRAEQAITVPGAKTKHWSSSLEGEKCLECQWKFFSLMVTYHYTRDSCKYCECIMYAP